MFKKILVVLICVTGLSIQPLRAESLDNRLRAATLPSTNAVDLKRYAQDKDWQVREVIAKRQSTPSDILISLSNDPSWRVRAALAHNLRAPRAALVPLVNDKSADVRYSVAHCGYTPPDLIINLLTDTDFKVRNQAVVNLNVPIDVLRKIAEGDSDISDTAKAALEKRLQDEQK